MPSARHQALARLLTERPEVLVALLRRLLGLRFPDDIEIHQGPETVRAFGFEDYRADGQVVVQSPSQPARSRGFVVEVQLGEDREKPERWVLYVVGSRYRLGLQTSLVIFTDSRDVARWASTPIDLSNGSRIVPYVVGPDQIPEHVDPDEARRLPALAVLAVVAHGRGPGAERVGRLAIETVRTMAERNDDDAMLYMDVITAFLDDAVMDRLEQEMSSMQTQEPISNFAKRHRNLGRREGLDQGRIEGYARALLVALDVRGFPVSDEVRAHINRCRDLATLERWHRHAWSISSTDELFDE